MYKVGMCICRYIMPYIVLPMINVLFIIYLLIEKDHIGAMQITICFILTLIFLIFILPKLSYKLRYDKLKKLSNTRTDLIKEKHLFVKEDKLLFMFSDGKFELKFSNVKRIINKNNKIYIFRPKYSICGIIPTNVFKDNLEKTKFLELIKN